MTFRIVAKARAWWPVEWPGVAEDGTIGTNSIKMRFTIHKVDDAIDLEIKVQDMIKAANTARTEGDDVKASAILRDAVMLFADDWKEVLAENEDPLPWNDENVRLLMNEPNLFDYVMVAYRACRAGAPEVRAGN